MSVCVHVHLIRVSMSHNLSPYYVLSLFFIEFSLSLAIPLTASPVLFFLPFRSVKYRMFFLLTDFTPC